MKTLLLTVGLILVATSLTNKGCGLNVKKQDKCVGFKDQHYLWVTKSIYSASELFHLQNEKDPCKRVEKFIIRFGLLPLVGDTSTVLEKLNEEYNIPPALKAAQAILESGIERNVGLSKLAIVENNWHGIKSYAKKANKWETHEYKSGKRIFKSARFASFETPYMGFKAHAKLLATGKYYKKLQQELLTPEEYSCLDPSRRKEYVFYLIDVGLKSYATDPNYPKKLKNLIEKWDLEYL